MSVVHRLGLVAGLLIAAPAWAQSASVRALVAPMNEALLASEVAARIDAIPYHAGQRFKKGDMLVSFDCSALRAALTEARAAQKAAELTAENIRELMKLNSAGKLEVQLAEAEVDKARARVEATRVPVDRCMVRAPFSGRVVERRAQPFESVAAGQPLLAVLDDSMLEIRMVIPSNWLKWLRPGQAFTLKVDETGMSHPGHIERIGARVDPVSQSVNVVGVIEGGGGLIAGMSGDASFTVLK